AIVPVEGEALAGALPQRPERSKLAPERELLAGGLGASAERPAERAPGLHAATEPRGGRPAARKAASKRCCQVCSERARRCPAQRMRPRSSGRAREKRSLSARSSASR